MLKKSGLFRLRSTHICDRCGGEVQKYGYWLCSECYAVSPADVRNHEVSNNSIEQLNSQDILCCICRKKLRPEDRRDVCFGCHSHHMDGTHSNFRHVPESRFGTQPTAVQVRINYCHNCSGLRIVTMDLSCKYDFRYFKVGESTPRLAPYECPANGESNGRVMSERHDACRHQWLTVHSDVKDQSSGWQRFTDMRRNPVFSMMGLADEEILRFAFGEIVFWCWLCGKYFSCVPQDVDALPTFGRLKQ